MWVIWYLSHVLCLQGLISQKNIFDLVALIDAFKDRIEGGVLDEGPAALPPVLPRLIVHVEDIEQQRGTFVIPRVLWSKWKVCLLRRREQVSCNRELDFSPVNNFSYLSYMIFLPPLLLNLTNFQARTHLG